MQKDTRASTVSLSLCICTRHRPEDLRRALQSVADSLDRPDQVIVSDDGQEGRTAEDVVAAFPFVEYQRGPRRGLGANRNACLARVRSSFISFIDDDVVLPASFLPLAYKLCRKNVRKAQPPIVSGVEIKHLVDGGPVRIEPANADFWGFQRLKPRGKLRAIIINAGIFPFELFTKARFDPKLRYGSEEVDIIRHAVSLGYHVEFEPELCVDHFPSEINRDEYISFIDASRLYTTVKDYWQYQRSLSRTLAFSLLAPPKLAIGLARRYGLAGLITAAKSTLLAISYALRKDPG